MMCGANAKATCAQVRCDWTELALTRGPARRTRHGTDSLGTEGGASPAATRRQAETLRLEAELLPLAEEEPFPPVNCKKSCCSAL